jgi:hypothetical protein
VRAGEVVLLGLVFPVGVVVLAEPAEVGIVDVGLLGLALPQAVSAMVANPARAILATRRMDDGS